MTIKPKKMKSDAVTKIASFLMLGAVIAWPFGLIMNLILNFHWLTFSWTIPVLAITFVVYANIMEA